ncbi:alpha/beta fold hydrolase [Streptomyces sp. NPDC088387]|uniref:alpha/beta hydrolase n=1 Tax=Streptomyces sp. NPDC088387 TaxID=3365859 RepID=UPI0038242EDF
MRKVVSRDGTTIAYEKAGEGPPIVLLNGSFRDHTIFDALVPELTAHCTVYVYDRRGRGESGDSPVYAVAREIEDLEAVIGAAGGSAAVFAGSSGANLAVEAVLAGAPVSRLALHEPFYRVGAFPKPPWNVAKTLRVLMEENRREEAVEYYLGSFLGLTPDTVAQWRQGPIWRINTANAHTLAYDLAICGDCTVPADRLAGCATPTLVLNSDHTSEWLRAAARATADAFLHGRSLELPGSWHRIDMDVLGRALTEFTTTEDPARNPAPDPAQSTAQGPAQVLARNAA